MYMKCKKPVFSDDGELKECGGLIVEVSSQVPGRTEVDFVCARCRRPANMSPVVVEDKKSSLPFHLSL